MRIVKRINEVDEKHLTRVDSVSGTFYLKRMVREPAGIITVEDFAPGDTVSWYFWYSEVHYITKGKAEMTYSQPPFHTKQETTIVEEGDTYLIYPGDRITWKVISKEPFRHLCFLMPAPAIPTGEHLILEHFQSYKGPF